MCVNNVRLIKLIVDYLCTASEKTAKLVETTSKTARTIQHGARFSRKLQRRLTRRTVAEARALKHQGTECIHVMLYVIELVRYIVFANV